MQAIDQQTGPKITSWQSDYERVVDGLAGAQAVVGLDEVASRRSASSGSSTTPPICWVAVHSGQIVRADLGNVGAWPIKHGRPD